MANDKKWRRRGCWWCCGGGGGLTVETMKALEVVVERGVGLEVGVRSVGDAMEILRRRRRKRDFYERLVEWEGGLLPQRLIILSYL